MFCPSCASRNVEDARFCNMCGARMIPQDAGTGTLRGPHASAPKASPEPSSPRASGTYRARPGDSEAPPSPFGDDEEVRVSLAGIGIQSRRRAAVFLGGGALFVLLLGLVGGWLATRPQNAENPTPPPPVATPLPPNTPLEIGTPLPPETQEAPESTQKNRRKASPSRAAESTRAVPRSGAETSTPVARGESRPATPSGEPSASVGASNTVAGSQEPNRGDPSAVATRDPDVADEQDAPRDMQMDLYSARVRRFIRQYYASRAQLCFDHATRNNESIRGTVVVQFVVGATGQVSSASPARNTTGNDALAGCLAMQVRNWRLPAPPGGEIELSMPFSR